MKQRIFAVALLLLAASLLLAGCTTQSAETTQQNQEATPEQITPAVDVIAPTSKTEIEKQQDTLDQLIADGTYTEQTTYRSPGGINEIEISLTVEDDIVKAASVTVVEADQKSTNIINNMNAALSDLVVGKSIDQIADLPKQISGSSLTTAAFKQQVQTLIDTY